MKKFFSLIAAVLFAGSMMATTVTKTVAELAVEKSFTNSAVCTPFDLDEVISVSTSASDANTGKYYSNGEQIRLYQTGAASITLTAAEGYKISSVTLTYASQNTGILVEAESGVAVDFENVQSATFTVGNSGAATNGQVRITEFSVTYDADGVPPTPVEQYYLVGTMNDWAASEDYKLTPNNANEYKIDITLAEGNQEMKVKGVLEGRAEDAWYPSGMNNNFVINDAGEYTIYFRPDGQGGEGWHEGYIFAEYHAAAEPISCLDIYQMAKNDVVDLLNDVVVTFVNGKNVWVRDASASMLIYLSANATWQAGDVLSGVAGVVDVYNGIHEIKPSADQAAAVVATPGEVPAAEEVASVAASDVNKYIVMKGVEAEGAFTEGSQSNITINGVVVRNQFKNGYTFESGKHYDIYGVVTLYQNNPQVYFISAEEASVTPIDPVEENAVYNWSENIGTTILGTTGVEISTVKIHNNVDEIPAIKFGSSYVYADGKWVAIKPAEGKFLAGDTVVLAGVISNDAVDGSKYAMIDAYAADGATRLFRGDTLVNGKKEEADPAIEFFVLEAEQDSIFFGRYGNTGMFITLLKVVRGAGDVPPTPEHTYTVAGGSDVLFGTTWAPANTANDMTLVEGLYTWEKTELTLAAGNIEFKVCEDHAWTNCWPSENYQLNIAEAGIYTVTITFNAETKEVAAVATKTGEAVVIPTVAMHGNFLGSWADTENFAVAEGNATASLTLALAAGNYEFGMRIGGSGNWTANGANLTREANTTNLAEGSGNMHIAADVAGDYVFTYTYETQILEVVYPEAPVVPDTITIVIDQKVIYYDYVELQGWWQFIANNDEYAITISNISTTQAAGTYTIADLDADWSYITVKATETEIAFVEGLFELTEGADGSRTIEGTVTGDDGNIYIIKLVFVIPTAQTTVNVEIPEWGVADASQYYGWAGYILYGETEDENIYVQIVIPGSNPVGQFTYDDCYAGGTGIEVAGDYQDIYSMDINVALGAGNRAIITADILCFDYTLYHVTTIVGEGVDNIDAAVKAIKSIVNGQVVIEKAGKTYNMNGAVIR